MPNEMTDEQESIEFDGEFSHRDRYERNVESEGLLGAIESLGYDIFGDYFDARKESYEWLQKYISQAHISTGTVMYMSKTTIYTLIFTALGFFFGGALSLILTPLLSGMVSSSIALVLSIVLGIVLFTGGSLLYFIGKPLYIANERGRNVDATLPYAITFMYALSRGGMDFIEILETLSNSEDAYGEVAREVQPLVREMELFSTDFQRALRNAGQRTPSKNFEDFMDDLISIFDSGADLTNFLEDAAEDAREQARREQEDFIQVLELMGEVYVTVFVAGPLFLIIITVVMSLLGGGGGTGQLYGIIYGLLPILNIGFFVLISAISMNEGSLASTLDTDRDPITVEDMDDAVDRIGEYEELVTMRDRKQREERLAFIRDPVKYMISDPRYSLVISAPISVLFLIVGLATGIASPTLDAFVADPVVNTTFLASGPLLIMMTPYMIFHEIQARRNSRMMSRLPDALKQLASANAIGLTLTESLTTVSQNTSGRLGNEFGKVSNDIQWNNNVNAAMIDLANRLRVPVLTRTTKLITKANESSGDIEDVLEVAAKDVSERHLLKKERAQQMMMYTVVVLISFCVYLFVIVLLDITFLSKFANMDVGSSGGGGSQAGGGALDFSGLPIKKIRMAFYHSTVIQGLGSGLLAGQLGSNNVKNGMKYSVALIMLSSVVFFAIT